MNLATVKDLIWNVCRAKKLHDHIGVHTMVEYITPTCTCTIHVHCRSISRLQCFSYPNFNPGPNTTHCSSTYMFSPTLYCNSVKLETFADSRFTARNFCKAKKFGIVCQIVNMNYFAALKVMNHLHHSQSLSTWLCSPKVVLNAWFGSR